MNEHVRTLTIEEVRAEAEQRGFALQVQDDQVSFTLFRPGRNDEDDPHSFDVTPVELTRAWCWLRGYVLDVYDDGLAVYRPYSERNIFPGTAKGLRSLIAWVQEQESSSRSAREEK
jgi:hypothetical protein